MWKTNTAITSVIAIPQQENGLIVGKEGAYGMSLADGFIKWVIWGDEFLAEANLRMDEWCHIALVYDFAAKTRSVYFDGELIAEKGTSVTIPVSDHPLTIGKWATSEKAFNRVIDEVMLLNKALSEEEIRELMMFGLMRFWSVEPSGKLAVSWGGIKSDTKP